MLETFPYKLVVISDLHLSEGWDENGYLQRNEDFFFDQNFERFLGYLLGKGEEGKFSYRLVIAGDFVDFLEFTTLPKKEEIVGETLTKREDIFGLGTSEVKIQNSAEFQNSGDTILILEKKNLLFCLSISRFSFTFHPPTGCSINYPRTSGACCRPWNSKKRYQKKCPPN